MSWRCLDVSWQKTSQKAHVVEMYSFRLPNLTKVEDEGKCGGEQPCTIFNLRGFGSFSSSLELVTSQKPETLRD